MRHATIEFIKQNLSVIQLSITLAGLLVTLFVGYVTYRIAPLATHIDKVDAFSVITAQEGKDARSTYIPIIVQNQTDIAALKTDIADIKRTTNNIYTILLKQNTTNH